jgi:murein DD-endopeptidase MepM/ murein hydrolase activator NlpD
MRRRLFELVMGAVLAGGIPAADGAIPAATAVPAVPATADAAPTKLDGPGAVPRGEFGWPLAGFPTVLRRFDAPDHPYGPGHRGVDLGGWDGQPVLSAGDGVVVFAGMVAGRPVISVDHPNGLRTTYEPVVATVSAGQRLARGDIIGTLQAGHPGCRAVACLHWGVRRGQEYLDPLRLLVSGRVRLLPVGL